MTKKKKADNKADLEYEKAKEKGLKEFNADMEKLSKSNFEDFKEGVIKQLRSAEEGLYSLGEMIHMVIANERAQGDIIIEQMGKVHKDFNEFIKMLNKRLSIVEMFLLLLATKSMEHFENQPMEHEWKKETAFLLSINWNQLSEGFIFLLKGIDELDAGSIKEAVKMSDEFKIKLSRAHMLVKNTGMSMEKALHKTGLTPKL